MKMTIKEYEVALCELEEVLLWIENKFNSKVFKKSRKDEVREILERGKLIEIKDIAEELGITNRNVSSVLSYLRDDGFVIGKIGRGKIKLLYKIVNGEEMKFRNGEYVKEVV